MGSITLLLVHWIFNIGHACSSWGSLHPGELDSYGWSHCWNTLSLCPSKTLAKVSLKPWSLTVRATRTWAVCCYKVQFVLSG